MSTQSGGKDKDDTNQDLANNPFVALFPSVRHAQDYSEAIHSALMVSRVPSCTQRNETGIYNKPTFLPVVDKEPCSSSQQISELGNLENIINDVLERVFYFTVDPDPCHVQICSSDGDPLKFIFLRSLYKELMDGQGNLLLTEDNLNQALMERLSMSQPRIHLKACPARSLTNLLEESNATESFSVKYLACCYDRADAEERKLPRLLKVKAKIDVVNRILQTVKSLILSFGGTILLSPEVFPTMNPHLQLFHLFVSPGGVVAARDFVFGLAMTHNEPDDLRAIFGPTLDCFSDTFKHIKLIDREVYPSLAMIQFFTKDLKLAKVLVENSHWFPPNLREGHFCSVQGIAFEQSTLLGPLLGLTSISYIPSVRSEHFHGSWRQGYNDIEQTTSSIRRQLDSIIEIIHEIFGNLLRYQDIKHYVLYWLGDCLHRNSVRAQLYCEMDFAQSLTHSRDGFFLNLSHVLLKFAEPFIFPKSKKLLQVDPTYCLVAKTPQDIAEPTTKVHLVGLAEETMMTVLPDGEAPPKADDRKFKFITECFYISHQCIRVGLIKAFNNYHQLMKRLQQKSDLYHEARAHESSEQVMEVFRRDFEGGVEEQLSVKAHLLNPSLTELCFKFCIGSCYWLTQLAIAGDNFADGQHRDLDGVLPEKVPIALTFTPEFVVENIADCLIWLGHFDESPFHTHIDDLCHVMEFFSIYLGSSLRLKNPHLRAKLAEALGAFLPKQHEHEFHFGAMSLRENPFENSAVAARLLPRALLNLFVDIEFTGHSMEFEQKFGYRHHMYAILEHLWKLKPYYKGFYQLYEEGRHELQQNSQFSVFPRFINLLVNDATYLLDEALQYLVKIKELEKEKEQWMSLDPQAVQEKKRTLKQYESFARGYNVMANETVHALCYITTDITRPFASPCMVDRMAGFLNYFLLHLVGPKRRGLKVNDFGKYHFKPAELVSNIAQILINLGREEDFCRAVPGDGRSYSADLYHSAIQVLQQIHKPHSFIDDFQQISEKFEKCAKELRRAEEDLPEAPEEFLDPILGTLMYEPVRLPSSGKIVDKATISRHLLSDPKDPFNRCPLSLDMVIPERELQGRIEKWMVENHFKRPQYSAADCSG